MTKVLSTASNTPALFVICEICSKSGTLMSGLPIDSTHTILVSGRIAAAIALESSAWTSVTEMLFRLQILCKSR